MMAAPDFSNASESPLAAAVFTSIEPEDLVSLLSKLSARGPKPILQKHDLIAQL